MKRKRMDHDFWTDIIKKRYIQTELSDFDGIVSLLYIDEVNRISVWEFPDTSVTVCDAGMKWLQLLPREGDYLITAMIDPDDTIVVWYIDMIAGYGFDADHVVWYDDLYLDLVVGPNGEIRVDDMDELQEALAGGDISEELYNKAISTAETLQNGLLKDIKKLNEHCLHLFREVNDVS